MAIKIVDFPMKNGDFPWQNVNSPEGTIAGWVGGFKHLEKYDIVNGKDDSHISYIMEK